jgi:hypothetical protein
MLGGMLGRTAMIQRARQRHKGKYSGNVRAKIWEKPREKARESARSRQKVGECSGRYPRKSWNVFKNTLTLQT